MTTIQVFDPPMCCSTGVCGPAVDPKLVRFAGNLHWLANHGIRVERFNLTQQPQAFAANEAVKAALQAEGNACLPLILVDGKVASRGVYPDRQHLATFTGLAERLAAEPGNEPVRSLPVIPS
jgi:hypothetical protein